MRFVAYKKTVFSWKALKKVVSSFLQILGAIGLILGVLDIFFPQSFTFGTLGIVAIACISLFFALLASWPRREISRQFFAPDFKLTVKVGDLFLQEDAHLVIGMNDVFDTEKGDIQGSAPLPLCACRQRKGCW
jgi:hypothetical protein